MVESTYILRTFIRLSGETRPAMPIRTDTSATSSAAGLIRDRSRLASLIVAKPGLPEKLANRREDLRALVGREVPVLAAGNREQLIRDARFTQRRVQTDRFVVRHQLMLIAVDRENRRQACP